MDASVRLARNRPDERASIMAALRFLVLRLTLEAARIEVLLRLCLI